MFSRPFIIILDFFLLHLPNKLGNAFSVVAACMKQKPPNLNFISSLKYVIRREPSATQSIRLLVCAVRHFLYSGSFIRRLFHGARKRQTVTQLEKNININSSMFGILGDVSKYLCVQYCCRYTQVFDYILTVNLFPTDCNSSKCPIMNKAFFFYIKF